jgi:hypothetical protein
MVIKLKGKKMKIIFAGIMSLLIAGCVSNTPSLPEEYNGAIATIDDSFERQNRSKANIYYLKKINGKNIDNALNATSAASYGKGSLLVAVGSSRSIPAEPLKLQLVGQVFSSAPIIALANAGKNYSVEGELEFTPEKDKRYVVNGSLSEDYSAVWIEDTNGNVVSRLIEKKSSSYVPTQKSNEKTVEKALSREELFLNLSGGESESLVISKFGEPDSTSKYEGNIFSERPPTVTYKYNDLGDIQFIARKNQPLFIDKVTPIVQPAKDIASVKMQLSTSGSTLQSLAKGFLNQGVITDTGILDLFAEKIWEERGTQDPYMADSLAYLCKTLAKSGNARYNQLLQTVADTAGSNRLKRHAKSSLELLPKTEAEQFTPRATTN